MSTVVSSLSSGSLMSCFPRVNKERCTASLENRWPRVRQAHKVANVNGAEIRKQTGICPLGDITNFKSQAIGGTRPIGIPSPCKRRSFSGEVSPSKLRALQGGLSPPLAEEHKEPEDEYLPTIMSRLSVGERSVLPSANFMEQGDVNTRTRAILVDWLADVHRGYRFRRETLFLTVNLLDRYLSKACVPRSQLQLVGVVALLVAAKFEEVNPPPVKRLVYMTAGAFSTEELLTFECVFLAKLDFEVVVPTAVQFLDNAVRELQVGKETTELAFYVLELALLDDKCSRQEPSSLVAAALLVSSQAFGVPQPSSEVLASCLRSPYDDLSMPAQLLKAHLVAAPSSPLAAIRKKYSAKEHCAVAISSASRVSCNLPVGLTLEHWP